MRRKDKQTAGAVAAGLGMDVVNGGASAWNTMRASNVPVAVALRVLAPQGRRRATDALPAEQDKVTQRLLLLHSVLRRDMAACQPAADARMVPRTDHKMAAVYEQAVCLLEQRGRLYAEAYLRLYPVRTDTMMRVLYDHRRRRATGRAP